MRSSRSRIYFVRDQNKKPCMTKPKPKDQLQKRGRKSLFREEFILIAKAAARFGAIEEEIADELNVGIATITRWKNQFPEFRSALNVAKASADDRVERSLYQRANGFVYDAVKLFQTRDGKVIEHRYRDYAFPDTTAIIFFLKNRRPERWRDVHNIEAEHGHYIISERPMTEEEWIREHCSNGNQLELEASPASSKTE